MNRSSSRPPHGASPVAHTVNRIHIAAPADLVLRLAARVEDWPTLLAHYRRVEVLATRPEGRIVEMVAVRRGIPVPVRWRALQRVEEAACKVEYLHIGGVTRGMEVAWQIVPAGNGADVTILHDFAPNWPWPGPLIARHVVCDFFVHAIADATLDGIKAAADREAFRPS
jgi:polyketide cyclase/dehydrase/lipid transport protein